MTTQNSKIEDLFFSVSDSDKPELIDNLYNEIIKIEDLSSDTIVSGIDYLLESWGDSISKSKPKAEFCLKLAMLNPPDSEAVRISLQRAFSCLKTSMFMKSAVVAASGLRDSSVTLPEVANRFLILEKIEDGVSIFNPETGRIGSIEEVDSIISVLHIKWEQSPVALEIPLKTALASFIFLKKVPKIVVDDKEKIVVTKISDWKKSLVENLFVNTGDHEMKQLTAVILQNKGVTPEAFEKWWGEFGDEDELSSDRHPSESRSLHELNELIKKYPETTFDDAQQEAMIQIFAKIKFAKTPKVMLLLAETLAILADYLPMEVLMQISNSIADKVLFWNQPLPVTDDEIYAWEKLQAKYLPALAKITVNLYSSEYVAKLLVTLPLRCWNSIVPELDMDSLIAVIESELFHTADVLMWIWRNRNSLSADTINKLNPTAIGKALDSIKRTPAVNELKKLYIGDKKFQNFILEIVKGHEMDLLRGVQACESLKLNEKQSLLVKFSALSPEVKIHLEQGAGKKMFAAVNKEHIEQQSADAPDITSINSFIAMTATLDDIINTQIPENSAAIAHARSYGDLRENAEYKAAKERQAFLYKRREEIEEGLNKTRAFNFSEVNVDKTAIPGSVVTIKHIDSGLEETFNLLGVWDGDMETNSIAYTSRLGEIIKGKKVGEEIELPDGKRAKIADVQPLPQELLDKLAEK